MSIELADILQWTYAEDQESYINGHRIRMLRTLESVPAGDDSKTLLEMGSFLQMAPVCKYNLNYGNVYTCYLGKGTKRNASTFSRDGRELLTQMDYFDAEKDNFPYKDAFFDTILCCEVLPHLQKDPVWMLFEINRCLKQGGTLVLTVPNANSIKAVWKVLNGFHPGFFSNYIISGEPRLARDYAPGEMNDLMAATGFQPESLKGCNYAQEFGDTDHQTMDHLISNGFPEIIREECLIMVARKTGEPKSRYPKWLYY